MQKKLYLAAGFSLALLAGCAQHSTQTRTGALTDHGDVAKRTSQFIFKSSSESPSDPNDTWSTVISGLQFAPDIDDGRVKQQLEWFTDNDRYFERTLGRARHYLPYIVEQLDDNDLPMELALLPFIESAYNPYAYSHMHASGLWQFIPGTAREMGLRQDRWYEGRRDVVDSTEAAIRYLKMLNKQFDGDWLLSLAAYNAGPGTVGRAMESNRKKGLPTDFWNLKLPSQTKAYVPKLVALSKVLAEPGRYDIERPALPKNKRFAVVELDNPLDLSQAAKMAGLDPEQVYNLNPGFSRQVIPANGPFRIILPADKVDPFRTGLANTPRNQWMPPAEYMVRAGDNLGQIAARHNVTVAELQARNNLNSTLIRAGQVLMIPGVAPDYSLPASAQNALFHEVRPGDNLWTIAREHNTTVRALASLNGLSQQAILRPGQKLKLGTTGSPPTTRYQVRRGDSLYKIAQRFNVGINDLLAWNNLSVDQVLRPGQQLQVFK